MKKMRGMCPSCGAPVVAEICSYCGTATGLNTAKADMEYPVLECREAIVNFWTAWFPMIFAVAFGGAGILFLIVAIVEVGELFSIVISVPFIL